MSDFDKLKRVFDEIHLEYDEYKTDDIRSLDICDQRLGDGYNEGVTFEFDENGRLIKVLGSGE